MKIKLFFKSAVAAFLLLASFGHINADNYEFLIQKVVSEIDRAATSWDLMKKLLSDSSSFSKHFLDSDEELLNKYDPTQRKCSKVGDFTYRGAVKNAVLKSMKAYRKEDRVYVDDINRGRVNKKQISNIDEQISNALADKFDGWRSESCGRGDLLALNKIRIK